MQIAYRQWLRVKYSSHLRVHVVGHAGQLIFIGTAQTDPLPPHLSISLAGRKPMQLLGYGSGEQSHAILIGIAVWPDKQLALYAIYFAWKVNL